MHLHQLYMYHFWCNQCYHHPSKLWIPCTFSSIQWVWIWWFWQYKMHFTFQVTLISQLCGKFQIEIEHALLKMHRTSLVVNNNKCLLLSFLIMHWSGWYDRISSMLIIYIVQAIELRFTPPSPAAWLYVCHFHLYGTEIDAAAFKFQAHHRIESKSLYYF